MKNKGIAVECKTAEQKQVVSDFGRKSVNQSTFAVHNDWSKYVVVQGDYPGCHTANSENEYKIISYEEFEKTYLKKPKLNPNTDFEFTPGEVYVGSWSSNRNVIFKPHTPLLHNRCQFITGGHDGYRDDVHGCCTGDDISFRKANTDEKIWLEACIKAEKFVPIDQLKPAIEEKFKVGDWVMCLEPYKADNYLGEGGRLKHSGPYQIEEIDDTCVTKISGIKVILHFHRFRLCTSNEIPQSSEIKVGDWVKCIGESATPPGKSISSGWERDLVFKVTSITDDILWGGKNSCGVYNVPGHVRKAYSDEIPEKERGYVCKAVTTGNGASLAVGQEYTYGNKNGYRNTVWVIDSITETTVTFRQKDKPNVKAPYSLTKFPEIINKDQFWLVEEDNFAYFAKIIDSGSGMSPDDKGKTVKVLKKRPEGKIANDFSSYDTYVEGIEGTFYQTLHVYGGKDFKYGRCAANMLQREGIEYAEGYQMTVSDKSLVKKITIDEPNLNDLLEQAKKMYPIGTKFYCANGNVGDGFKGGGNENYIGNGIWEVTKYGICDPGQGHSTMGIHSGNGWLWYNGNWAMIVDMGQNSNPVPKIDNVLIWRNGEVSTHINPDQIKLSDSSVQIKVPTSASVTLKNTENEVKIIVKQSQSIKIN